MGGSGDEEHRHYPYAGGASPMPGERRRATSEAQTAVRKPLLVTDRETERKRYRETDK